MVVMILFGGRNVNVTLEDIWLSDCKLSSTSNVFGLIQTETCLSASLAYSIRLLRVQFKKNKNAGGSAGLHIEDPSCSDIVMNNVSFLNNTFLKESALSSRNSLTNLWLLGNRQLFPSGGQSILYFPPQSRTLITGLSATKNDQCLSVERGELSVYSAIFKRTWKDHYGGSPSASIAARKANVTVLSVQFIRNQRAIHLDEECNFNALDSVFSHNGVWNDLGSAIYAYRPQSIHLVATVFKKNDLDFYLQRNHGTVFIRGSSAIINNSLINVSHCQFRENLASDGVGFWITDFHRGRILVDSTTFSGNTAIGSSVYASNAAYGGVFYVRDCKNVLFRIQRSTFDLNTAASFYGQDSGGAIYVSNIVGELFIYSSLFRDNFAGDMGGAISVDQEKNAELKVNVRGCSFEHNRCTFRADGFESYGGSIFLFGSGVELHIKRTIFRSSSANRGGSIYAQLLRSLQMERCTFHSNRALGLGGALIAVDCDPPELRRSRLINNTAEHGGAIYSDSEKIFIYNCVFAKNMASGNGGALATVTSSATIRCRSCRFLSNSAKKNGGAIHVFPAYDLDLNDVVFMKNQASFWGGAISILLTEVSEHWLFASISQCHFEENQAVLGGGPAPDLSILKRLFQALYMWQLTVR